MGTTRTAIRTQTGVELAYVLVIEGYKYLLTDGLPSKAVAAWAATDWTLALPGLQVSGDFGQSLRPWSNELSVRHMSVSVQPENTDQFGIDMFKRKPDVRSELTLGFDTSTSGAGGFNINVKDAGQFAAGANVMIGNETFKVTGTPSGTTIPVALNGSGVFHPFAADGKTNSFPGEHSTAPNANVNNVDYNAPVYVSSSPTTWIGRKVALYVHRVTAGAWDVKAQAELLFAGAIKAIGQDGLNTTLECDGIEQQLLDAQILSDQWSGKIKEGYVFQTGDFVRVTLNGGSGFDFIGASSDFTAGTDFTAGRYSAEEFGGLLADFLDQDAAIGVGGSDVTLRWDSAITQTNTGPRFTLTAQESTTITARIYLVASQESILRFLGFDNLSSGASGLPYAYSSQQKGTTIVATGDSAPFLVPPIVSGSPATITLEDTDGTFADHTSLLPPNAKELVGSGETWSFYSVGDNLIFFGRRDSDTQISGITIDLPLSQLVKDGAQSPLRVSNKGESARVKQVFFAAGTFTNIMSILFASTDGNGTNIANIDILPFGGGIPWSLLGDPWLESLEALEQQGVENSVAIVVAKPTRLWDAVRSDFTLRMAQPVWKDGGLQVASLTIPNASTADHILNEANKADTTRTSYSETDAYSATTLKVEINRNPITDKYTDERIVRSKAAYQNSGGAGPTKTIKARNSYTALANSGASAEALFDVLASRFMPMFSKPLKMWRRSISFNQFHIAPGDTVTFSDDFVRAPDTGTRGVTSRAAVVTSVSWSFGISSGGQQMHGEVELLYTEEDRCFPLAPSMEHAYAITTGAYTDGYDAAADKMLVHRHKFSGSAEDADATHFTVGDAVRITAIDPADPDAASTFTDTIATIAASAVTVSSVDYDAIGFTTGFTPGAGLTYLIEFGSYSAGQDAQLLVAYQADDSDGRILDTIDPNLVATENKKGSHTYDLTQLPARHAAEQYGDGVPLSTGFVRDQIRMANNLVNFKTAPHMPMMAWTSVTYGTGSRIVVWSFPFYIGRGKFPGGLTRKLNVAPLIMSASVSTNSCFVTSSANPPKGGDDIGYTSAEFYGPKNTIEFTTSNSAALEIPAPQELDVVAAENIPEFTWITVEADNDLTFRGLPEFWLGPLQ